MSLQEIKEELSRFVDWYSEDKKTNTDLQSKINNVFDYIATKEIENAELKAQIEKMKCCGNCKHVRYELWGEKVTVGICNECRNYNKWESAE